MLPPTADCKSVPEGREVKARGALPSAPTSVLLTRLYKKLWGYSSEVEQDAFNIEVAGSIPAAPTKQFRGSIMAVRRSCINKYGDKKCSILYTRQLIC